MTPTRLLVNGQLGSNLYLTSIPIASVTEVSVSLGSSVRHPYLGSLFSALLIIPPFAYFAYRLASWGIAGLFTFDRLVLNVCAASLLVGGIITLLQIVLRRPIPHLIVTSFGKSSSYHVVGAALNDVERFAAAFAAHSRDAGELAKHR